MEKHGKFVRYYESGKVKITANFKNDKEHGETVSYHEDGKVKSRTNYKNGYEVKKGNEKGKSINEMIGDNTANTVVFFVENELYQGNQVSRSMIERNISLPKGFTIKSVITTTEKEGFKVKIIMDFKGIEIIRIVKV